MKIVITGASGQIGRALLERLAPQHDCVAVVRGDSGAELDAEVVQLDLDEAWSVDSSGLPQACDAVIYLAQSNSYRDLPGSAGSLFRVNVVSLASMLEYARSAGATHFVLASTGGVYQPSTEPLTEGSPLITDGVGRNLYAWSKLTAEALVASYEPHFVTSILRFFFVYGAGAKPGMLIPSVVERVRSGAAVTLQGSDGHVITPTHASDAAAACAEALKLKGPAIVNVAGPEAISLRALAETTGELYGREPVFETRPGEPPQFRVSIAALRTTLGLEPCDFRTGLARLQASSLPERS